MSTKISAVEQAERTERINELCALYKQTESAEVLRELWELVGDLAYYFIKRITLKFRNLNDLGVEEDDLMQCGYFALPGAIKYYDSEKGSFGTVLEWEIKKAVTKYGFCNSPDKAERKVGDPLLMYHSSLDAPLSTDEDSDTLYVMLADPDSMTAFERIENEGYISDLHDTLVWVINRLPERVRPLMLCRLQGMRRKEIMQCLKLTETEYYSFSNQANQKLHDDKEGMNKLRGFIDDRAQYYLDNECGAEALDDVTDFFNGAGLKRFKRTFTGAAEQALLNRYDITKTAERVKRNHVMSRQLEAFADCLED